MDCRHFFASGLGALSLRPANAETAGSATDHVAIRENGRTEWEPKVVGLLEEAQDTFEPHNDPKGERLLGTKDNRSYHRALSTKILRNAHADGGLRTCLMHGLWESVWDHENSHLDGRFLKASAAVGAAMVSGPVEPFYLTRKLVITA